MQSRVLNGRYELLNPLGQGGMATVYRGRDIRLGRAVAVKLLHGYYSSDDEFLARFQHEAMSAANLSSHPNIVDVYDVGKDGDTHYIVMELVEGTDLKALIDTEAPLPPERALHIAIQVADGLDYAHRRGLIHRDVKPQNVLLAPDGEVRIADFGIAKSHLSTAVTQAGMTFGTADYISPEQAQGLNASPQSDVYSLGVMLYEMLSGRLPFVGDTPMAVALQHIQKPPPPLRQLNPAVSPALEAIVMRAIAKDPQHRPASAKQFAQELRDFLAGRAPQLAPVAQPQYAPNNAPTQVVSRPAPRPATERPLAYDQAPRQVDQRRVAPPARQQYVAPPLAPPPTRERSGFGFGTLLIGLLLLGGVLALAYFALNTDLTNFFGPGTDATASIAPSASVAASAAPSSTPVPLVTLPNLVGLSEVEVAGPGGLFEQLKLRRKINPDDPVLQPQNDPAPAGTIIFQDPVAGTQVPEGSEIAIRISLGPRLVALPNVAGQAVDQAQAALQQAGFVVQRQDQPSQTVPAGQVISQEPAAGGQVPEGSTVTLMVSAGDVVPFPDVIANGTQQATAIQALQAAGFSDVFPAMQGRDILGDQFDRFQPNEVVSATVNGQPVDVRGKLVPRGGSVVIGVRAP